MAAGSLTVAAGQEPDVETTVKDGVYTTAQAARGRERYDASCQRCHGADLTGGAGRSLTGVVFLRDWTGLTLDGLYERMQSMPPDGSENLSDAAYVDIISYVLERNGFPRATPNSRPASSATSGWRVRTARASSPTSPSCGWSAASRATATPAGPCPRRAPEVRASDPAPSAGDALAEAHAIPLGDRDFKLLYVFPSPEAYLGHKVETKGLLIRDESGAADAVDSINVTSVQGLAEVCE